MDPFEAFEAKLEPTEPLPATIFSETDPAAEFLAREQAELEKIENNAFGGDEFTTFGTAQ
jgi:hypothetical protein